MKRFLGLSLVAMMAMTVLVTTSCNKYPEGPKLTLLTAKARISGDWKLTGFSVNGTDYTSQAGTVLITIEKDGTYKGTTSYVLFGNTVTDNFNGTWEFNDDKTKVTFTDAGSTTGDIFDIIMLKNKEMKLQQIDNGDTSVWTYTAQ
jgi:hypothetical protein